MLQTQMMRAEERGENRAVGGGCTGLWEPNLMRQYTSARDSKDFILHAMRSHQRFQRRQMRSDLWFQRQLMALWVMFLKPTFLRENFAKLSYQGNNSFCDRGSQLPWMLRPSLCLKSLGLRTRACSPSQCLQMFIPYGLWRPYVVPHLSAQQQAAISRAKPGVFPEGSPVSPWAVEGSTSTFLKIYMVMKKKE